MCAEFRGSECDANARGLREENDGMKTDAFTSLFGQKDVCLKSLLFSEALLSSALGLVKAFDNILWESVLLAMTVQTLWRVV